MKGYKVFKSDWTCRGFQYTCPGTFEEDVTPSVCDRGFHFCVKAVDCFRYYDFDPDNKVAEVIAYGDMDSDGIKTCTNKIQVVREIPWAELLEIVNAGKGCTGYCNSGNYNSGHYNSGNYNSGNWNSGHYNSGNYNSGNWNSGNYNSGNYNSGDCNSGNYNSGNYNSGIFNSGNYNSGDWNKTFFSAGCFCTEEPKILLFNKPSDWTMRDWLDSDARQILRRIPTLGSVEYVRFYKMSEQEKADHPEAETTHGYLKIQDNPECVQIWWNDLNAREKSIVKAIPNFDKAIFKEITGIIIEE